jgi:hypothetical protein
MKPAFFAQILLLSACSGSFGKGDTASGNQGPGGDDGGSSGGNADGLPDLTDDLDRGGCEGVESDGEFVPVPGAASYFAGTYEASADEEGVWTGTEQWILYANQAWQDLGQGDCTITWFMRASEGSPGACGACDLGLQVSASVDLGQTDCPEGLVEDEQNWSNSYGVARLEENVASWFFAQSGNPFANGYHLDGAVNFISEKSCTYF